MVEFYSGVDIELPDTQFPSTIEVVRLRASMTAEVQSRQLIKLSGELRTPLTSALNSLWRLEETSMTRSQGVLVSNILDSNQVLLVLVETLLEYSEVSQGKIHFQPTEFSVVELAAHALKKLNGEPSRRNMRTNLEITSSTPLQFFADATRISQALTRLIVAAGEIFSGNFIRVTLSGGAIRQ